MKRHTCCGAFSRCRFVLCLIVGMVLAPGRWGAAQDVLSDPGLQKQFEEDLTAICQPAADGSISRVVGSAGYERTALYLQAQFSKIGAEHANVIVAKPHYFPVMMPVTRFATLSMTGGGEKVKVFPFWPAKVRVNSTPEGGIRGKLVYIQSARVDQIIPKDLAGQIAVVDVSAAERWKQAFYFGAKALIVLGDGNETNLDLKPHDLEIPVNFPRFYLPAGTLADQIKAGKVSGEAVLDADVRWEKKSAVNFYVVVKPAQLKPAGWPEARNPGALMISVPFDASGLVPDLAQGASQAVNTAAGLALLRRAVEEPLQRPVVFFFGGGDTIQFRASREMFMAMADSPSKWSDELSNADPAVGIDRQIKEVEQECDRLRMAQIDPQRLNAGKDGVLLDRISRIIDTDVADMADQLFRRRIDPNEMAKADVRAKADELEKQEGELKELKFRIQKNPGALNNLGEEGVDYVALAKRYVKRTLDRLAGSEDGGSDSEQGLIEELKERRELLQTRVDLHKWLANQLSLPEDSASERLIELEVAIDLSDRGVRAGPMTTGEYGRINSLNQVQDFKDWLFKNDDEANRGEASGAWLKGLLPALDPTGPISNLHTPLTWLCASMPIGSEMGTAWGVPAFSLITLDDMRLKRDTPNDVLRIDHEGKIVSPEVGTIEPQLVAVQKLLWKAWDDPAFRNGSIFNPQLRDITGQVVGFSVDRPVPDLPEPGYLLTYSMAPTTGANDFFDDPAPVPWTMGMRRAEIMPCDAEGRYLFEEVPRLSDQAYDPTQMLFFDAYRIPPDQRGRITGTSDVGDDEDDTGIFADLRNEVRAFRTVVFNCTEFSLVGLHDPRFLQNLAEVRFMDTRRNDWPKKLNAAIGEQLMAGFVEPGIRQVLLFRYGVVGNRLILLNMPSVEAEDSTPKTDQAPGYTAEQLNDLGPIALRTTNDFYQLNQYRLTKYRQAGVSSQLIDQLHGDALSDLRKAMDAEAGRGEAATTRPANAGDVIGHANLAWANESRVYAAQLDLANDVVRAAIFLLILCVPFSFCMERLVIASPNIYRQLTWAFVIFLGMAGMLRLFHPAFKISTNPAVVILAFSILFMSTIVMAVIYGRFNTELAKIRSGRGSTEGASFARASVLMSAVLLGIANMRKRRFRTLLTSVTVVLITFAVLCFTSSSTFLDTTALATGVMPRYPTVMLRQRGYRPMPPMAVENLRATLPGRNLVQRWWNMNAGDVNEYVDVIAPGSAGGNDSTSNHEGPKIFAARAVLGISPGESELSNIAEVIGAEKYARLENGETHIIYLCNEVANQLGVKEGDHVLIGGNRLEVAGLFDAHRFDTEVMSEDGDPLAPLDYSLANLDSQGQTLSDNSANSLTLDNGAGAEMTSLYHHLSATNFVIVPAEISRLLPNGTVRSIAARLKGYDEVKPVSDDLAKRFAVAIFAGYEDGVKMIAANNSLPRVSGGAVAVPLMIAGLIIFNTMMGSIAERRREIHVYTSLGLAPLHVGALFVAEALTYGLLGTVFGYVFGQLMGTVMNDFHLLGKVTLNYSGTSAMLTMGLILLIVLLSALVPARIASQIAAPSIERTWKVPLPKGDEIMADLPFSISKTAADGALAYLAEFFDAHQEGSIGKFSSDKVESFRFEDESKRFSRGLKTVVWLTPFDLGVRQHLMLLIHPGAFEDIYEVQVVLQRLSGENSSWYRMNRTFLTELRQQFLQWRSLSPRRMMEYVEQSRRLFV